ncbi:MAG: hypothetical protein UT92_C0004G0004 [Candidatus Curtissbacteria bacterium GW2011_GWA1_40_24]|uniref:Uncharacterized protein n=1 Tax=Candidatus Curtissbacteria bacterium GW2011_GWA1_40_24 TaxID=1618406 RepID=A0A0G0RSS4_9BACT|nr:MAG: hypothetical protein UT92_C0004G0004 [Candidatus Curtissbacteria bacterium GW2011_GWA1_40_24]
MARETLNLSPDKGANRRPRFRPRPNTSHGRIRQERPRSITSPLNFEIGATVENQIQGLSRSIINTFSRFDEYLKAQGEFVVDTYSVGPEDAPLILPLSEEDALERFRGNINQIESIGYDKLKPEWVLIHDNLVSVVTFFEERQRVDAGKEKMNYSEYLLKVSGLEPTLIPWELLEKDRSKTLDIFRTIVKPIGVEFEEKSPASVGAALFGYQLIRRYHSPMEINERFKFYDDGHRFQVGMALGGRDLRDVQFNVVWVEEDKWWRMHERMGLEGNTLYANWHERHRQSWDEGVIEMYSTHEPQHFILAYLIREEILKGHLDPAAGILPIPSTMSYQSEGIAQTVSQFAPIELSPDAQLAIGLYRLEKRALTNGLYLLETDASLSVAEVTRRIRRYMSLKSPKEINQLLEEGITKPFERAYLPAYGISDYEFTTFSEKADGTQKSEFVNRVFSRPMTPTQVRQNMDTILKAA